MGGYLGISTKGHAQRKRNPTQSLDFVVQNDTILDVSTTVFLSDSNNKQGFICLLSDKINAKIRLTAKKYSGDADRFMVTTALEALELHKPVLLKADDTYVLVMAESQTSGLFLEREGGYITLINSDSGLSLRWLFRTWLSFMHSLVATPRQGFSLIHPTML